MSRVRGRVFASPAVEPAAGDRSHSDSNLAGQECVLNVGRPCPAKSIAERRRRRSRPHVHLARTNKTVTYMRLEAGFASSVFGSTHGALVVNGRFRTAAELPDRCLLDYAPRAGKQHNGRLDLNSRYYLRHSPHRVSVAAATASLTGRTRGRTMNGARDRVTCARALDPLAPRRNVAGVATAPSRTS